MSRRARAVAFGCAALACAALAAATAGGYRSGVEDQLGELRSVVVARQPLPAKDPLDPSVASRALEVRQIPTRFVPAGALSAPTQAIGRVPAARIPAGSYVVGGQLRAASQKHSRASPGIGPGHEPVEIHVSGAEALASRGDPRGSRVDVVVTSEPGPGGGEGHTRVAAKNVELLDLRESADPGSGTGLAEAPTWAATLSVRREQALRLIQADNFARQVRLIPHSG